jgi:hypothetical protein
LTPPPSVLGYHRIDAGRVVLIAPPRETTVLDVLEVGRLRDAIAEAAEPLPMSTNLACARPCVTAQRDDDCTGPAWRPHFSERRR